MIVGRNRLKLYNGMSRKNQAKQQNHVFGLTIAMRTFKSVSATEDLPCNEDLPNAS